MIVIPREICREEKKAFAHEWLVRNERGAYAAASIAGALTRREHGLLVAKLQDPASPRVLLGKVDEEVEVEGQLYKLGANQYQGDVISPDGFLYLQQVAFDGVTAELEYEASKFQLRKTIWLDATQNTLFLCYTASEQSAPFRLTLLPMCDARTIDTLTRGNEQWRFQVTMVERGIQVQPSDVSPRISIFLDCDATFTPLDLWYWRFQLPAAENAQTDLFVPGLFRAELKPGQSLTMIVTAEEHAASDFDVAGALHAARLRALKSTHTLPAADKFTPATFRT